MRRRAAMRHDEYQKFDATGLAELVDRGEVTPTELLECALGIAAEVNPQLNALAHLIPDQARERARGQLTGPFSGVPFLVKELLPYPGLETNWGSRLFRGYLPAEGSPFTLR